MKAEISQALQKIISDLRLGEAVLTDSERFRGALADVLHGSANEPTRNLMNIAISMDVYNRLKAATEGDMSTAIRSMASEMNRKHLIPVDVSLMAIESIAELLGYVPDAAITKSFITEKSASIIKTMTFGSRDWLVLDEREGKRLIISKIVLEDRAYHEPSGDITWESCTLRKYLNGEFLNTFSEAEKGKIVKSPIENKGNPWVDANGGDDTEDNVFLLSLEEIVQYFGDSEVLKEIARTNYYISDEFNNNRAVKNTEGVASSWWLRTPGSRAGETISVLGGGAIYEADASDNSKCSAGVRPAMWVNI